MSNFDVARDALNTSLQSSGSAMKEHAKWSDSLEARLNKLKATWQSFAQSFMNSSLLKGGIEALRIIVSLVDELTQSFGTFGTIGLGVGIRSAIKNFGTLKTIFTSLTKGSAGAAIGLKSLATSFSAVVGAIGISIAAASLLYNKFYKEVKEKAAELRQETIAASDEYLSAATSFEQAYIKYSGRTDLTTEEESELESAIQGTVDALENKSSALQDVVNSSNDYVASLEHIADAEIKETAKAAKAKKIAAEKSLNEIAMGYESFDGSEVDIELGRSSSEDLSSTNEAIKIAKELGREYFKLDNYGKDLQGTIYTLTLRAGASTEEIIGYYYTLLDIQEALSNAGQEGTSIYDDITARIGEMSEAVEVYTNGVYEAVKAEYQLANGIPNTAEEYVKMREAVLGSDDIKGLSSNAKGVIADSLDSEYGKYFDLTSAEIQSRKLIGILDEFGEIEASKVETFLNMRTAVNNNECTIGEYMSQFDKINEMTAGWSEEAIDELNTTFGIDADKIKEQYEDVKKYLKRQVGTDEQREMFYGQRHLSPSNFGLMAEYAEEINESEEKIENFLNSLSASELQAVVNLKTEIDWQNASAEDIMAQIEKEAEYIEAVSFSVNLELEAEKLENLNTAISEAVSGAGLGSSSMSLVEDMFGDLDSYDPTKLFERTANGIRMNTDEFRKLNDEYKNNNIEGFDDKLSALGDRYNQTMDELTNLTYGSEEYNEKLRELDGLESQISATEQLASQYRGLASAYQTWQMAESAGSQRDMYESMLEGLENVDDEISRGWLDDGTIEFLRLIKGENISATATTKELKAAYDSLDDTIKNTSYSVRDFFTVDEDGNSTNDGVYNFLDAIGQLEEEAFGGLDVVQRDGSGNIIGFDFQVAGGDKAIADALGISEELVQIMVRAADDAGFVVSMDGTYQQLDTLKDKAQEAANKLKELGITTFGFDLNTGNEDSVFSQYEEALKIWEPFTKNKNADGTIDMTVEGAEEAFTLVSTLQSMVDKLSEPAYMKLDATQVEKDMKTPLSKLQEYERLTQQERQLQLKGADTSELDKSQEEIIDYFDGLDPEIKAELGIKGLTREEIQAKVEAGEIEIPATIDLQVEMNQSMRDMVNVALYNAGLIDEEELKKRVDIELYAGEIDDSDVEDEIEDTVEEEEGKKTTIEKVVEITGLPMISTSANNIAETIKGYTEEEQQVVLEFIADPSGYESYTPEEKEAVVKFLADTVDVDGYTPEEKEAYAKYLVDGGNLDAYTPEEKEAIAKYLVDGGDIDNYTPEQKEAITKFLADTENVDNYTPEEKQAIAKFIKDSIDVDNYQMPTNKQAYAKYLKDTYDIDIWTPEEKFGDASYTPSLATTSLPAITGLTAWYTPKIRGSAGANGTANVNGTAFANGTVGTAFKHGDWGVKKTQTALTGELGQELVVYKNRYWTVGDDGAEFATIPRGAIVFNHKQTEELFNNGKVTSGNGRAKALVSGTAFAQGSRGTGGIGRIGLGDGITKTKTKTKTKTETETVSYGGNSKGHDDSGGTGKAGGNSSSSKKSGSGGDGGSDSKDEFEEVIDWIETAVARIEREIDRLDQKANNIYKSWSERNGALADEISKVGDEIELQQQAYDEYMDAAADVGLSEEYAEKVRNGTIDIETITDEELKEKVDEYQKW